MKLNEKYLQELKSKDLKFELSLRDRNMLYLNPNGKDKLYRDVTSISFTNLYANLIISLNEENLIDTKFSEDIKKVKWFLENKAEIKGKSSSQYNNYKILTNKLYVKIKSPYIVEYMDLFYRDLINKYVDKIIYIDVDLLILDIKKENFQNKTQIEEVNDFKYDVDFLEYFYAFDNRKYIKKEEYNPMIESVGIIKVDKKQLLESLIKMDIRSKKLDKLGI